MQHLLGRTLDGVANPKSLVARFMAKSIECLRMEIQDPQGVRGENADALVATVRTPCRCEIHAGSDGKSVWRVHVKGAKPLVASINP